MRMQRIGRLTCSDYCPFVCIRGRLPLRALCGSAMIPLRGPSCPSRLRGENRTSEGAGQRKDSSLIVPIEPPETVVEQTARSSDLGVFPVAAPGAAAAAGEVRPIAPALAVLLAGHVLRDGEV